MSDSSRLVVPHANGRPERLGEQRSVRGRTLDGQVDVERRHRRIWLFNNEAGFVGPAVAVVVESVLALVAEKLAHVGAEHDFALAASFTDLLDKIANAYDNREIQLDIVDDKLVIHDIPDTMETWINDNIGQIEMSNIKQIVQIAHRLQITVSSRVVAKVRSDYPDIATILLHGITVIDINLVSFKEVLRKVRELEANTIVIYTPTGHLLQADMDTLHDIMSDYALTATRRLAQTPSTPLTTDEEHDSGSDNFSPLPLRYDINSKNIVITNKVCPIVPDVILSTTGITGPLRRNWFSSAKTQIYYSMDVNDKINKKLKINESNIHYQRRDERKD